MKEKLTGLAMIISLETPMLAIHQAQIALSASRGLLGQWCAGDIGSRQFIRGWCRKEIRLMVSLEIGNAVHFHGCENITLCRAYKLVFGG